MIHDRSIEEDDSTIVIKQLTRQNMQYKMRRKSLAAGILYIATESSRVQAFTLPLGLGSTNRISATSSLFAKKDLFFATDQEEAANKTKGVQLFSDETLQEANDALSSVGWGGVAPSSSSMTISEDQMGELTSDDPFVRVRRTATYRTYD